MAEGPRDEKQGLTTSPKCFSMRFPVVSTRKESYPRGDQPRQEGQVLHETNTSDNSTGGRKL